MRSHVTLKITLPHINFILVETWEDLKLFSATIAPKDFKKKHLLLFSLSDKFTNHQACLASNKMSNRDKADDIVIMVKAGIVPIEME